MKEIKKENLILLHKLGLLPCLSKIFFFFGWLHLNGTIVFADISQSEKHLKKQNKEKMFYVSI